MVIPSMIRSAFAEFPHGMQMSRFRRISRKGSEPTKTDGIGAKMKLNELMKRARGLEGKKGTMIPIEALMTVSQDEWTWQDVDRDVLERLSHRLDFQSNRGLRREILMTDGLETAMGAASVIVELDGGCVLIETLEP